MTYEHDIFVSYAHVDNTVVPGTDQGWVTSLAVSISETLKQTLGRSDVKVWMDYRLSGNEPLTEQLLEAVRRWLTLLVIQSPGYVNSSGATGNGMRFLQRCKGGSRACSWSNGVRSNLANARPNFAICEDTSSGPQTRWDARCACSDIRRRKPPIESTMP